MIPEHPKFNQFRNSKGIPQLIYLKFIAFAEFPTALYHS